ncbi:MAG: hypothetical protein RIG62_27065 [Cyclobacteriaceae bacterium]
MSKPYLLSIGLLLVSCWAWGQGSTLPLDDDYNHLVSRYEIRTGQQATVFDTNTKPYRRSALGAFLDSLVLSESGTDRFNLRFLRNDNWAFTDTTLTDRRAPLLKYFYRRPSDFWHVKTKGLLLHINPVLHFEAGKDGQAGTPFINTRGIQLHGTIDDKIGFYTLISENQMAFPDYANDYIRETLTVPYQGFWKGYGERGVDFLNTRGYINFAATPHVQLELGYGKNFIGNGYRSLVLSDFSNNYAYFRGEVNVWRIHYTYLLGQLTADILGNQTGLYGTQRFPIKYFAFHRLGVNITDKINLGLFETIVYGDENERFDARYLNPFVFYRAVEQQNGSNGNALVGLDADWILGKHWNVYAQFVLDELIVSELRDNRGWWGNKYAFQVGGKYIDVFTIDNLDLQLEYNRVRPYTYAHEDLYRAYTHYRQPLAHPLGSNLQEIIFMARYQAFGRLTLQARWHQARYGADTLGSNWGNNVLLDNRTRVQDYGNELRQGIDTELTILEGIATYQLWHNVFVDARLLYRREFADAIDLDRTTNYTSLGLRVNIARQRYDY